MTKLKTIILTACFAAITMSALSGRAQQYDSDAVPPDVTVPQTPYTGQPAATGNPQSQKDPLAVITTSKGTITIRLFAKYAPQTVANFVELCQKGFYNGLTWHRVEPGFCIQGGCPRGDGTGLYIDPATNQPTDIPTDCAKPHAMEVTGAVNLAEKFPGPVPPDGDQDQFVKDACTRMTDAYLAPVALRKTTLTLIYSTISLPSWSAGSKQVSCSIGATLGNGGWSTLLNSAKGPLLINGQPPVAVPDIPEERLDMAPIPLPPVDTSSQVSSQIDLSDQSSSSSSSSSGSQGNDHLPGQQATPTQTQTQSTQTQSTQSPTSGTPLPPQGNTFLNGPPPPPGPPQGDGGLPPQDGPPILPPAGDPAAPAQAPAPVAGDPAPVIPVAPGPPPGQ